MNKGVGDVMRDSHVVTRWLLERLLSSRSTDQAPFLRELRKVLSGYVLAVDESVLPALRAHGWDGGCQVAMEGHFALKRALAELIVMADRDPSLRALLLYLDGLLAAQRAAEDADWIPALERLLPPCEQSSLGVTVLGRVWLHASGGATVGPRGTTAAPDELLDEARLILRTLEGQPKVDIRLDA